MWPLLRCAMQKHLNMPISKQVLFSCLCIEQPAFDRYLTPNNLAS